MQIRSMDAGSLQHEAQIALTAAATAGQIAMRMQADCVVHEKADASPVSDADLAANDHVCSTLQQHFPHDGIVSEETDPHQTEQAERVWVIDPIDGTKAFIAGEDEWAVHIALVIAGELRLGVVAIPAQNAVLCGVPGMGVWDERGTAVSPKVPAQSILLSHRQYQNPHPLLAYAPDWPRLFSHSVGYKAVQLLQGTAACYLHPRPLQSWDVAAPAAIMLAAGGAATTITGAALAWTNLLQPAPSLALTCTNNPAPLLANIAAQA